VEENAMRRQFLVTLDVPDHATIGECSAYVLDAVASWRGQCRPPGSYDDNDPGDPMFGLDPDSVHVVRVNPNKRKEHRK
jgi:hypothetical protein